LVTPEAGQVVTGVVRAPLWMTRQYWLEFWVNQELRIGSALAVVPAISDEDAIRILKDCLDLRVVLMVCTVLNPSIVKDPFSTGH
jgi:hypothetical protein